MMPLKNIVTHSGSPCSIPSLFISLSLLCILPLSLFFFHSSPILSSLNPQINLQTPPNSIKVYVADLPRSLNYGLLENYWALDSDSRIGSEVDNEIRKTHIGRSSKKFLPYPENPIIKQYSTEYWILGDLMTPEKLKLRSFAKRVFSAEEAGVIFVPFLQH
ncbi:putative 1-phosphatidylinositol-3-phosphate 5-kinase FAB1D-like [Capsicum annuum]|nr:putative 1-phosphatidylinositol-3-phosphate 5-kinase FAB1D-like [Capsicum annuum]KAF3672367.1 putative 1-phosphatidylinositol-3-phosphate 5-kinase FAB1D-like [Capsicum annuum]